MTDKVEGLREKAFEALTNRLAGAGDWVLVVRLEDAEAVIEAAERRGAEREREGIAIYYEEQASASRSNENANLFLLISEQVRARTEGRTKE